jgi:predicted permease
MKKWLAEIRARLGRVRSEADIDDELRTHLELQVEDNLAAGMTPEEARRRARVRLGQTPGIIERVHDQDLMTIVDGWWRDFRLGMRAMRKSPAFCLTAVLTLGFGIGANTAIFALLYGLLLRSLAVAHPEQLAHIRLVSAASQDNDAGSFVPYRMLELFRREQRSFVEISAWLADSIPMQDKEGILRLQDAGMVSGNAFPLLGVEPYLGRLIVSGDDVRGGPAEGWPVVLSFGFWNSRFGADPQIMGKQVKVANIPVTIIGVAPRDFHGPWHGVDPKLYLPIQFMNVWLGKDVLNTPDSIFCAAIGRLKRGITISEARAEIALHQKELIRESIPAEYQHIPYIEKASLRVDSARSGLPTYFGYIYTEPLWIMQGLVGVVLLLCCVNIGGLMMSKVHARQREFAVRTAIGAARWRLIRQYLLESFAIALAGAALGAAAAWYGTPALLHFFRDPMMSQPISVRPDQMVFWATGLCAICTTLLFGTVPAWRAGRSDAGVLLKSRTAAGGRRQIAGRAFIPIQVALSLVLVAVATLLSQSLSRIRSQHTGFEIDHVTIQTPPFHLLPQKGEARLDLYQRMVDRLQQMPGIRSAAVTWYTPMTGIQSTSRFEALSKNPNPREDSHMAYNAVGPGYFRTMETHLLEGREFERNERRLNVCILNQSAANYLFPHEQALGQYVRSKDATDFPEPVSCRVIGIAEDAKFANLRDPPPRTIYFPLTKKTIDDTGNLVFLMNSATKAEAIAGYRKALSEIAPTVPLVLFVTLKEQMDAALGSQRLTTTLSNLFAGLALFLSAVGLYGLLSSSVLQRTGEIGVRIALGAKRGTVLRMILTEALGLLATGILLGGFTLLFTVRFIQKMLFGISAFDPATMLATLVLLILVGFIAAISPALRASSVDPMEALRAE